MNLALGKFKILINHAQKPNKNLHLTVKSVTFFVITKIAPLFTSAEVRR